jgi:hypothetical protein
MRGTFSENLYTFMSSVFVMEIMTLWVRAETEEVVDLNLTEWSTVDRLGRAALLIDVANYRTHQKC